MWSQKPIQSASEDDLPSGSKTRSKFSFGSSKSKTTKKEDSKKSKRAEEEQQKTVIDTAFTLPATPPPPAVATPAAAPVIVPMEEEERPAQGKYRQPSNASWRRDPSPPYHQLLLADPSGKITADLARQLAEYKPDYSDGPVNRGSKIRASNVVNVINFVSNNIKNDSLKNSKDFKAKLVALAYQQMQASVAPTVNNLLLRVNSDEIEIERQALSVYTQ